LFPAFDQTARSVCGAPHRALGGEAAPCHPADRRAGPQSRPARCRAISELVIEAHVRAAMSARPNLLARYDRARRADVTSRTVAIDMLNRSLLSDFLP